MDLFKQLLRDELQKRRSRNPYYSLRAFARDMDVSPSRLSEVMNGKDVPTLETGRKMIDALGLPEESNRQFYEALAKSRRNRRIERRSDFAPQSFIVTKECWHKVQKDLLVAASGERESGEYVCLFIQPCPVHMPCTSH